MSAHIQAVSVLNQRATSALIREIGIVDTIRFLNQFQAGLGNYTEERDELFRDMSVKDIINGIKEQRKGEPT